MRRLAVLALLPAALLLSGCSDSPNALNECTETVAAHFEISPKSVSVTDTKKSPIGAYDWHGAAGNGTFGCASPDGTLLTTVIVFDAEGMPETLVARSSR